MNKRPKSMRLKSKVVLITRVSKGIGKGIAFRYVEEGSIVVLASRSLDLLSEIADSIMRKDTRLTKLTDYEKAKLNAHKERNKQLSNKRYIVEQYFGIRHMHCNAFRARFTRVVKALN